MTITMQAIQIDAYGGPDVVRRTRVDKPQPKDGEVLVKVLAAGVNPVDWKIRNGLVKAFLPVQPPFTLGGDLAGTVEAVGKNVSGFKPGDAVFGMTGILGAYAEYAVLTPNRLAIKPAQVDFIEAAAVPMAAITAWQGLFQDGGLQPGQRVLIHAGAGGVGSFAVQMAHAHGAYVMATASSANLDFVRGLGADEVIDYRTPSFENQLQDLDLVLDTMAGETQRRSWKILRQGGTLVSTVGPPDADAARAAGVTAKFVIGGPDAEGHNLRAIADLIATGKVRPYVQSVFPLSDAVRAIALSEGGHTRGKIVLRVDH